MDGPAHGGASVRDRAGSPSSQLRSAFTRTALPVVDPLASGMHTSGLFMTLYYPLLCLCCCCACGCGSVGRQYRPGWCLAFETGYSTYANV